MIIDRTDARRIGVLCALVAALVLVLEVVTMPVSQVTGPDFAFSPAYHPPVNRIQTLYNTHDGQAFASLAMDPTLARPGAWQRGKAGMAYRAARPLVGWLAWAGSFGQPGLVQWSLAVVSVLSVGLLGFATAELIGLFGKKPTLALLLLLLPGTLAVLHDPGLSDALGAALALLGLCWWIRGKPGRAVALMSLAALCRDATVLVPIAIGIVELWHHRKPGKVLPLAIPPMLYACWIGIIKLRIDALPTDYQGNLTLPFVGLVREIHLGWTGSGIAAAVLVTLLVLAAIVRRPPRIVLVTFACFAALAVCSGAPTWHGWRDGFNRSLLVAQVLAFVVLLPAAQPDRRSTVRRWEAHLGATSSEGRPVEAGEVVGE